MRQAMILEFPATATKALNSLDAMLDRGLITQAQHWCGIHLRWLSDIQRKNDNPGSAWRHGRDADYYQAKKFLSFCGCLMPVLNLCLCDSMDTAELAEIRSGLDMLDRIWRRQS